MRLVVMSTCNMSMTTCRCATCMYTYVLFCGAVANALGMGGGLRHLPGGVAASYPSGEIREEIRLRRYDLPAL